MNELKIDGAAENVKDEFGDIIRLMKNKRGIYGASTFNLDGWNNIDKVAVRPDDVFLCSYSKSGCHWMWAILRMMLLGEEANDEKIDKESYMMEIVSSASLENLKSPRILNNHARFEEQNLKGFLEKKVKVVHMYRNTKDVAVSHYHHHARYSDYYLYNGTFDRFIRRYPSGKVDNDSIFEYLKSWSEGIQKTKDLQVFVVSYEDLKENCVKELRRLDTFLGTHRDDSFLQRVAEATDISAMQKKAISLNLPLHLDSEGKPIMYRKGQVGDWKNHFTVADNEWFDQVLKEKLPANNFYNFRYTL